MVQLSSMQYCIPMRLVPRLRQAIILTQSQSATVYFFCTISYTVAVCDCVFLLYDFLHSRSLRLCISSVRFLTQSQSATVYFFCTISYTVAVCDCVFHLYDFFLLLSTLQRLISLTCLDRF